MITLFKKSIFFYFFGLMIIKSKKWCRIFFEISKIFLLEFLVIITETIELPINEPIPVEVPVLNTDLAIQANQVFRIDDTITYDIVVPLKQRKPIQFFKYGKLSKGKL